MLVSLKWLQGCLLLDTPLQIDHTLYSCVKPLFPNSSSTPLRLPLLHVYPTLVYPTFMFTPPPCLPHLPVYPTRLPHPATRDQSCITYP